MLVRVGQRGGTAKGITDLDALAPALIAGLLRRSDQVYSPIGQVLVAEHHVDPVALTVVGPAPAAALLARCPRSFLVGHRGTSPNSSCVGQRRPSRGSGVGLGFAIARVERLEGHAISDDATLPIELSMAGAIWQFGSSFLARVGDRIPYAQRKAIQAIASCRTPALGGHVLECGSCDVQGYAYHSCGHRSCPKCMGEAGNEWFETRRRELLPVPYFHVVFTVPKELNRIIQRHRSALYPVLMQAAAKTLLEVAAEPQNLGGTTGVMAALHTWSSTLIYHLHVHCLVPAGAVDEQGQWIAAKGSQLAPESALAQVFRATLRSMLNAAVEGLGLPKAVFRKPWQVHVEQPQHGAEAVLRYLGRSLYRGPLADYRIEAINDKEVVFKYRAGDRRTWRTMTLEGHEFLRRFLQHVWPKRLHKVRYFGLCSRKSREQLEAIRQQLLAATPIASTPTTPPATIESGLAASTETARRPHWLQCPHCGGQRKIVARFARGLPPPPLRVPSSTAPPPP